MGIISSALGKSSRNKSQGLPATTAITLDYPQEGEVVTSAQYTFRISARAGLKQVEVSINGASWQPCRATSGFWWFDWKGYQPGTQLVLARATSDTGEKVLSRRRQFTVKF